MIYLVLSIVCFIVFYWAKNKASSDWMSLCSSIYGGTGVDYRYLIVTIISLLLTILFVWLSHTVVISYINKLMA